MAVKTGAVACGHPATAEAAREILEDGGNAFDAVIAATCAAAVAEPVLCSLAGGGFLLAYPADQRPRLYDFFVETPLTRPPDSVHRDGLDFYPIQADFGTATQEFHIGLGAAATPGAIAGLFAVHRDLARLPMARLVQPAMRFARDGVKLREVDAYLFSVVGPVLTARKDSRGAFTRPDGTLLQEGDSVALTDLARSLEALAAEGEELFYKGEMGGLLVQACRDNGGLLTAEDLAAYSVRLRDPLDRRYRGARILTNPPPSTGGVLIAFALELLAGHGIGPQGFGALAHLDLLARIMDMTNRARIESGMHEAVAEAEEQAAARLFDPALFDRYAREVRGRPASLRGTTHISVIDAQGNIASLTLSNGEGCGYVLPGTGIMINNMLGEEDLNPTGFHRWPAGQRLASMMSPSIALLQDGSVVALGSGGSNRIRTAILQVLSNLIDFQMPVDAAVYAPRLHFEAGVLNIEADFESAVYERLPAGLGELVRETISWPRHNLFFGGVHAVCRRRGGTWETTGDPRRGGAALIA